MTVRRDGSEVGGRRTWLVRVRFALGLVGLAFALAALRTTAGRIDSGLQFSTFRIAIVVMLAIAASFAAASAWSVLIDSPDKRQLRQVYYTALVGKYIPGGVFQAAGQISLASEIGLGLSRATSGYVLSIVVAVIAGLISAIGVAATPGFSPGWRMLGGAAFLLGIVLAFSRWMPVVSTWIGRLLRRSDVEIPQRSLVIAAAVWDLLGLALLGVGYAIVLHGFVLEPPALMAMAAFTASWVVGFLALPFPAGLGVREGVLVILLSPEVGAAAAVGASLMVRLAVIIAEIVLFGIVQARRRNSS